MGVKPANLVKGGPQLGSLVDVNLAGLLGIRLAEFLAGAEALQAALKDAALAGEVGCAVEAQVTSEQDLVGVKEMGLGIAAEINGLTLPVDLERVGAAGQRVAGRAVVGQLVKVLVLAVGGDDAARGFWRGTSAVLGGSGNGATRRPRGDAIASRTGALGLGHTIGSSGAHPGGLGRGDGFVGRQDAVVAAGSTSLAIGLEKGALLAQPIAGIAGKVLHDLGAEREGQLVVFTVRREHLAEEADGAGADMAVDDALVLLNLGVGKERRLRRARGGGFVDGIEDGVFHDLVGRRDGCVCSRQNGFAVRRDGRRHWQRVVGREAMAVGFDAIGSMIILAEAVENRFRRRHEAGDVDLGDVLVWWWSHGSDWALPLHRGSHWTLTLHRGSHWDGVSRPKELGIGRMCG